MRRALVPADFKESRSEPRMRCVRLIDLLPCRGSRDWKFIQVELRDCSLHGLAVLITERFEVGEQFLVKLKMPGGVKLLLYTVENCTSWDRSRFRVGSRFTGFAAQELAEDLGVVLDSLVKGGKSGRTGGRGG